MTELERYREATVVAMTAIAELQGADNRAYTGPRAIEALNAINAILNPQPEMETVEVVRWAIVAPSGFVEETYPSQSLALAGTEAVKYSGYSVVPLTGQYQRPKPQKVARSVSVEGIRINDIGQPRYNLSPIIKFPDAAGKTVTLTATWEE